MVTVTVGGQAGAGGLEVGPHIAGLIEARYVHHLALRKIARRLNATVSAVVHKELNFSSGWATFLSHLEVALNRTPWHGMHPAAMPIFTWPVEAPDRKEFAGEISDRDYVSAAYETAAELANQGRLVIAKRAGCLTLRDMPHAVHVGLFASKHSRVLRMADRLDLGYLDASQVLASLEKARKAWFHKLGGTEPDDPTLYDVRVSTDFDRSDLQSARRVLEAVRAIHPELAAA